MGVAAQTTSQFYSIVVGSSWNREEVCVLIVCVCVFVVYQPAARDSLANSHGMSSLERTLISLCSLERGRP